MKYYRVKPQFDNLYVNPRTRDGNILVAYELYTETEIKKMINKGLRNYSFIHDIFEVVEIPKSKIYWLFGARFESK